MSPSHIFYHIWKDINSALNIATSRSCWMAWGHSVTSRLQNRGQGIFLSGSVYRAALRSYRRDDGKASGPFVYERQYWRFVVKLRKWINTGCDVFLFLKERYIIWHHNYRMTLGNCPTWQTNPFQCIYLFIVLYMFRACHAHHQEKQIVSIQLLVIVTPCWWQCRVLVGGKL